ncbi:MAG: AmmeMemoRadiSam system protein B [Candidatus Kapaibacterium sp.]
MLSPLFSQDAPGPDAISYRPAALAGAFYPADPDTLRKRINEYLDPDKAKRIRPEAAIHGIVVPHAGYDYSGWVAGRAFREIEGRGYDAVVVIGPSHREVFEGASIYDGEAYTTPLGNAMIDQELADSIAAADNTIMRSRKGHSHDRGNFENSIEVQIPFLQVVLPDVPIVPIAMGAQNYHSSDVLMQAIVKAAEETGRRILLVGSTDLSHYHDVTGAREMDIPLVQTFDNYDYMKLSYKLFAREWEACGAAPMIAVMLTAEQLGANNATPLLYATSAEAPGVKTSDDRVVGYMSGLLMEADFDPFGKFPELDEEERARLLEAAKESVSRSVGADTTAEPGVRLVDKDLSGQYAAFVTLKKEGQLRGCMGHTIAEKNLLMEVEESARMAATRDMRFRPVAPDELDSLDFEITVLSRFKRVLDTAEVEPGRDGVYLRLGRSAGLFLPQVATEQGWDREALLENLGQKAGLSQNAYQMPEAELFIFRSLIIEE